MKQLMTKEDALKKIVKLLVKEFREKSKSGEPTFKIGICNRLFSEEVWNQSEYIVTHSYFGEREGNCVVTFQPLDEFALYDFSNTIYNEFVKTIKMQKNMICLPRTESHYKSFRWTYGTTYTEVRSVRFLVPCKEFLKVNKKLASINAPTIPVESWWFCETFGKRSHYNICSTTYYATDKERCEKMLAYLKGKKKVTWKDVRVEHLEDQAYGEEYETEWSGEIESVIQFTDAQGRTAQFGRYTY